MWINFWGNRYRVYKDDKEIYELLIYKKRIYVVKD